MANVNLVESNDISITQTDDDITLGIKDTSLNAKIINKNEYSTTQEIAIGKWIDGKTIYRKVFTQTNLTNSPYSLDISSIDYDTIVNMDGIVNIGNDSGLLSTWYSSSYNIATTIKRNTKKIDIAWSGWASLSSIIIVLEYTKTS